MRTLRNRFTGHRALGSGMLAAVTMLLAALPVAAQTGTPYTATGWITGVPVPGIWCTNALGQVFVRGNVHTARVQSSDPRLTGQRLIFVDGAAQADGSAIIYGTAYQEVGSWDLADPQNPKFTPTAGLWETTHRGTMQADNSLQLNIAGYGSGGTIDGLRVEETLTRAAGDLMDPAIPYEYTGTLKPLPLSTNLLLDDFNAPAVGWSYWGPQSHSYTRPNGQLVVTGHWPVITRSVMDSYTIGGPSTRWTVADGQTLEARVDLVSFSDSATWATLMLGTTTGFYGLCKGHDFVALRKWSVNQSDSARAITLFNFEKPQLPDTNVVLALALTRANMNMVVTARVLDKANPNSVLYESSVVDTPNADPALTSAELLSLSGMNLVLSADPREAPFTTGEAAVGIFQYNYDGRQPAAVATFDNLEVWQYEVPTLGIGQAVVLTWPDLGKSYAVEGASSVQGSWLPVNDTPRPGMKQMTVPLNQAAQFFRLRQAP
jgi:hypothetical protein